MESGVEEGRGEKWAWAIGVEWRGRGERCTRGMGPEYFGFGCAVFVLGTLRRTPSNAMESYDELMGI